MKCKLCGIPIAFIEGKPVDIDGDHRERCAGLMKHSREQIRDSNHEKRVSKFLSQPHVKNRKNPAFCKKCGRPLKFIKKAGKHGVMKWFPSDPDGSDHFDRCREYVSDAMTAEEHEQRRIQDQIACPPGTSRGKHVTHVWSGTMPPWDGSLGDFRDFSQAEKQALQGCLKLPAVPSDNRGDSLFRTVPDG